MGVFPLADTMTRLSQFPLACGVNAYASSAWAHNGWTDEVWWYPHPTTSPTTEAVTPGRSAEMVWNVPRSS